MSAKAKTQAGLSGQFFHSISKETGKVEWQGCVVCSPDPGWYLVQLFEWLMGEPNVRRLVRVEDMSGWLFYPDAETLNFSYERGVARASSESRDAMLSEREKGQP